MEYPLKQVLRLFFFFFLKTCTFLCTLVCQIPEPVNLGGAWGSAFFKAPGGSSAAVL